MEDFKKLFDSFSSLKVGVIGDLMLDTYMWGRVDRISPEAPVPVVSLNKKEYRIGGAGNVALNCISLGAQVSVLSVTGADTDGLLLEELLEGSNIDTSCIMRSSSRITTSKTRVISRNQQVLRLDDEMTADLSPADEAALLERTKNYISVVDPDIMIFEDYNKGVLTGRIIHEVMGLCKAAGIITTVDPKRNNFLAFKEADIFKPNLKEVKEGLNLLADKVDHSFLQKVHRELAQQLHHKISLVTLSDKGVFYQEGDRSGLVPSHLRSIADVSGAGDTVIAVASMVYAASKNVHLMAELANIAGGLVCEEVGTAAINKEKLLNECELLLS
ncbi:MAG TPA: bifunctional ADP-heptose synthase [Chitinophagaceae bacterium]|jgi:rfaE bifunctional protein kinase chain/domain|nr:bifunctional ADP-heptose synthase [Chitinophagaceae bacterium]